VNPRQSFDKVLEALQKDILRMASLVEQSIYDSVRALVKRDTAQAAQVIMGDEAIDELYYEIENKCVKLIATQQPIATDLRRVVMAFKILMSLERMGDYAKNIARATMCLSGQPLVKALDNISRMAVLVRKMVRESLDAYVQEDAKKAKQIFKMDDEVDYIFAQVFRDLQVFMAENGELVLSGSYLLYVNRYLERIANHATNIADAVIYLVTGEVRES